MDMPVKSKKNLWPLLGVAVLTLLIISPFDALPEAVLGPLGLIDDLGYGVLDIILLVYMYHKKKKEQLTSGNSVLDPGKKID